MMSFDEIIEAIGIEPYYRDPSADIAIYCADCRDILPKIPNESVDLVLTDPPFLVMFGTTEEKNELGNYTILEGWLADQLRLWKPVIKSAGNLMLLCDWRTYPSFWREAIKQRLIPRNLVVWIHGAARKWHLFRYCHQLALVAQKPPVKPCASWQTF
jgi:site-specific DNA-methyltransferase (adenine-specific)